MPFELEMSGYAETNMESHREFLEGPTNRGHDAETVLGVIERAFDELRNWPYVSGYGEFEPVRERSIKPYGYTIAYMVDPQKPESGVEMKDATGRVSVLRVYGPGQDRSYDPR
jgi:hypothetical protein